VTARYASSDKVGLVVREIAGPDLVNSGT
jgi:hypothetical protein